VESSTLWRLILIGIVILVAISLVSWLLKIIGGILSTALTIAIIVGVVWLLISLFSKRKAY
jgi:hypothetical protein